MLQLIPCVRMSSPLPRQVRRSGIAHDSPSTSAFPIFRVSRLLRYHFRGLLSVHSHYNLRTRQVAYATPYIGGPGEFAASLAAPVTSEGSDPVPGRVFSPGWISAFSLAHRKILIALIAKLVGVRRPKPPILWLTFAMAELVTFAISR